MSKTNIEWTDDSWNPVTGCVKISQGCKNCYAHTLAERFAGTKAFPHGFKLTYRPHKIDEPLRWRKPRMIFVNSMSDLFWDKISPDYRDDCFNTMERADHHIYQVLTKRPEEMQQYINQRYKGENCPKHIWLGVSVEKQENKDRINHLKHTHTNGVRFLSLEPLLEDLGFLDLTNIDWVIVGGESGKNHRPIKTQWVEKIQHQCAKFEVPFFFKQWGGKTPKANGNELHGKTYLQHPPTETGTML